MKLSEAVRIGAKLRPQATGIYFERNQEGQVCSCAMGAAIEGANLLKEKFDIRQIDKTDDTLIYHISDTDMPTVIEWFDDISNGRFVLEMPINKALWPIYSIITDLNDTHQWSREKIADWLEQNGY